MHEHVQHDEDEKSLEGHDFAILSCYSYYIALDSSPFLLSNLTEAAWANTNIPSELLLWPVLAPGRRHRRTAVPHTPPPLSPPTTPVATTAATVTATATATTN